MDKTTKIMIGVMGGLVFLYLFTKDSRECEKLLSGLAKHLKNSARKDGPLSDTTVNDILKRNSP